MVTEQRRRLGLMIGRAIEARMGGRGRQGAAGEQQSQVVMGGSAESR